MRYAPSFCSLTVDIQVALHSGWAVSALPLARSILGLCMTRMSTFDVTQLH